ncbi:hypothetical protein C8R44DRAFT_912018 [Mycena epipterygia]|nr:hypothetical protein C8R44DRAFT_912018 [Mycena epipterygia]
MPRTGSGCCQRGECSPPSARLGRRGGVDVWARVRFRTDTVQTKGEKTGRYKIAEGAHGGGEPGVSSGHESHDGGGGGEREREVRHETRLRGRRSRDDRDGESGKGQGERRERRCEACTATVQPELRIRAKLQAALVFSRRTLMAQSVFHVDGPLECAVESGKSSSSGSVKRGRDWLRHCGGGIRGDDVMMVERAWTDAVSEFVSIQVNAKSAGKDLENQSRNKNKLRETIVAKEEAAD